jgi:hypothetical protein
MRRSIAQLQKQKVSIHTADGKTYTGEVDLSDDNGVWVAIDPTSAPSGAPAVLRVRVYFPFAQMMWLAVADD